MPRPITESRICPEIHPFILPMAATTGPLSTPSLPVEHEGIPGKIKALKTIEDVITELHETGTYILEHNVNTKFEMIKTTEEEAQYIVCSHPVLSLI